jgi:malonate transporter
MMAYAILLALAPVFLGIALGYVAGRLRIVDNREVDGFNALVMDFALPASLFVATASAPRGEMMAQGPLFAILGVVMLLVYFGWYFLVRASWPVSKADASLQALTVAFPNIAGVGLPIASAVLGPDGTVPAAVVLAAGSILVSPLTLIIVEMSTKRDEASAKPTARVVRAIRRALTKPIVVAPALGILISMSGLQLGSVIEACLMLIGNAAPGVALFLMGLILSSQSFRLDWKVVSATWLADIVRPLLTAAVVFVLPVSTDVAKVAILLAAMPSGFFGILFAVKYRLDSATVGSMVAASTVLSIVTMSIAITVLFPH